MPTIRRASWRPRKMFGYDVESYKTNDNWELELNYQFRNSDITPEAREMLLRLRLDIWFIRLPVEHRQIAMLIKIDTHHRTTKELVESLDAAPRVYLTEEFKTRNDTRVGRSDMHGYIRYGTYHYSFVDGRVKEYTNGNQEFLWNAVRDYMYWSTVSRADKAALAAIEF